MVFIKFVFSYKYDPVEELVLGEYWLQIVMLLKFLSPPLEQGRILALSDRESQKMLRFFSDPLYHSSLSMHHLWRMAILHHVVGC